MFDASPFCAKVDELNSALEVALREANYWKTKFQQVGSTSWASTSSAGGLQGELESWREQCRRVVEESEESARTAQIKYDDLHARYVALKDDFEEAEDKLKKSKNSRIVDEHAAYELYVKRSGGQSISEVKKLVDDCIAYARRDNRKDSVLQNKIARLREVARFYQPILDRYPALAELVNDNGDGPTFQASSSRASPSIRGRPMSHGSGRGQLGRSQTVAARRQGGATGGNPNSNNLLATRRAGAEDFIFNWLTFSQRARRSQQ